MRLSAPTFMTALVSLFLVVIGILAHVPGINLPVVGTHGFIPVVLGYLILLAGTLVRGL